jgi:fibronectin-binding autotransporter adhesin
MRKSQKAKSSVYLAAVAAGLGLTSAAFAVDGTWSNPTPNFATAGATNGEWGNVANWTGGIVADGAGSIATFSQDWVAATRPRINLSNGAGVAATYTIGELVVTDTASATPTYIEIGGPGSLLLDNGANKPVLNTVIGQGLFWSGAAKLTGTNGFRKTGTSDDDFRGNSNGLSGTVVVEAGRIRMFGGAGGVNAIGTGDVDIRSGASMYYAVGGVADYSGKSFFVSGDGPVDGAALRVGNGALFTMNNLTINGTGTPNNRTTIRGDGNNVRFVVNGSLSGTGDFRVPASGGYVLANSVDYTGATVLENGALITRSNLATSSVSITGTGDNAAVIGWDTGTTVNVASGLISNTAPGTGAVRASGASTVVVLPTSLQTSLYVHDGGKIDLGSATYDLQPSARLTGTGTIKAGTVNVYEDTPVTVSNDRISGTNNAGVLTIDGNLAMGNVFGAAGGTGLSVDLGSSPTSVLNDKLVVTGTTTLFSPAGTFPINIGLRNGYLSPGTYTLLESGTLSGSIGYTTTLPAAVTNQRTTATVSDTAVANKIVLQVVGSVGNLVWNGPGGSQAWDVRTTANFLNAGTPDQFYIADAVTFDDTAATKTVQLTTTTSIAASAMTINNTAGNDYTFSNVGTSQGATAGNIGGNFPITKTGAGNVNWNFNIAGGYNGQISVQDGQFILNSTNYGTSPGPGTGVFATALGNSTLNIGPNGTFINRNTVDVTMGNAISGSGTLRLQTLSNLNLTTADNSAFSGPIFVENGRVQANNVASLGTGPITVAAPTGQTTFPTLWVINGSTTPQTITNNLTIAGPGRFSGDAALRLGGTGGLSIAGSVTLAGDASIRVDGASSVVPMAGGLSGTGTLSYRGPGTLRVSNANLNGGVRVNEGRFELANSGSFNGVAEVGYPVAGSVLGGGVLAIAPAASASAPNLLSATGLVITAPTVATDPANVVDIGNNAIKIDYTGASPLTSVKAAIVAGLDGVTAGEAVLASSDTTAARAIGYAEASLIGAVSPVFGATDADTLLIRHTVVGDTDLSGVVDFTDLLVVAQNYNGTGREWFTGDIAGYDGSVDFNDLLALAQNYNGALLQLPSGQFGEAFQHDWSLALSMVPEPTTLAVAAGVTGLALRRRRVSK